MFLQKLHNNHFNPTYSQYVAGEALFKKENIQQI